MVWKQGKRGRRNWIEWERKKDRRNRVRSSEREMEETRRGKLGNQKTFEVERGEK